MYADLGSNTQDVVMLINDVLVTDDLAKLDGAYQAQAGVVPDAPKIFGADGTRLPPILFSGFTGNPVMAQGAGFFWVIGPDRTLYWCGADAADVPLVVQMVLDKRVPSSLKHDPFVSANAGTKILSAMGKQMRFTVSQNGLYGISLFSADGRVVWLNRMNCVAGINSTEFDGVASGTYIARIGGVSGATSSRIVVGNRSKK